jgi:hypothetical protein
VRITASQLGQFKAGAGELPPPVEPQLWLVEEIVLLSLDAPTHRVRPVARIAGRAYPRGPRGYGAAVERLRRRGLLARGAATPAARMRDRDTRLRAILAHPDRPAGREAELVAFLAATGALPTDTRTTHLQARTRLASISTVPRSVAALATELRVDTMPGLAERLLPGPVNREGIAPPGAAGGMW